jgi:tetratricopeptide (TPR) repeat protein
MVESDPGFTQRSRTAQILPGNIMNTVTTLITIIIAALAGAAGAQSQGQPASSPPEQIGNVHFPTSCSPAVERQFDRAMTLLHSFWAKDAIAGFNGVLQQDPDCAIAYWGIAMSLQQNPLTAQQPISQAAQDALAGLDKAKSIGAKTQRERDYLAAIDLIYRDADKTEFRARRLAYEKAMETLAQRYPDDTEAAIFYALALNMTAQLTDKTYANQLKAAAILEKVLKQQPDHPGVAHYLIHSYDYPPIAERGLPAAKHYAQLAPNHPHALHMPSHIFTRRGMWQDSIDTNLRSAAAAKAESNGQEQAHAMDYLVHAYLQLGEDAEAKRVVAESASIKVNPAIFIGHYALAAMPARYVVERRSWAEAIALEPRTTQFLFPDAITHFARGLGYARTGDATSARKEESQLAQLRNGLAQQKNTYWSNQVEVQRLAVSAWATLAQGAREDALKAMRASADLEDSMEKHIVTPSPIVPARELLGEMLLEVKQPAEALKAFETSAQREPNRLRGVYGAAQAAARSGDHDKAKMYYAKFVALTEKADGARPELQTAKAYLAQR